MNYQNQFYPNNQYQSYPTMNNGIIWVQGIEGAKSYRMMPNSNTILMDSENDNLFYIKISDNVGMCNLRTFKFEEITSEQPKSSIDVSQFVTREEFEKAISNLGGNKNGKQFVPAVESKSKSNAE